LVADWHLPNAQAHGKGIARLQQPAAWLSTVVTYIFLTPGKLHLVGGFKPLPFEKYDHQNGNLPQVGVKNKNYLKPPSSLDGKKHIESDSFACERNIYIPGQKNNGWNLKILPQRKRRQNFGVPFLT